MLLYQILASNIHEKTMKLRRCIKSKIIKNENDENLKITEIALINCIIFNNDFNIIQESCIHLFLINRLVNYYLFCLKGLYFYKLLI